MKILFTTESYYPDVCGVSNVVTKLAEGLASLGHDVTIFTEKRGRNFTQHNNVKVSVFKLPLHSCSLDYYDRAVKIINLKFKEVQYLIFSDDIVWCKENLKIKDALYIESEEKRIAHEDMYLMSLCNHNIIANSTFSWWGAWLNKNEKKTIIAPKKWLEDEKLEKQCRDVVCKDWMKI